MTWDCLLVSYHQKMRCCRVSRGAVGEETRSCPTDADDGDACLLICVHGGGCGGAGHVGGDVDDRLVFLVSHRTKKWLVNIPYRISFRVTFFSRDKSEAFKKPEICLLPGHFTLIQEKGVSTWDYEKKSGDTIDTIVFCLPTSLYSCMLFFFFCLRNRT